MILTMKREKSALKRLIEWNDFIRFRSKQLFTMSFFKKLLNAIGSWTVHRNSNWCFCFII